MVSCTESRPGRVTTLMRAWAVGAVSRVKSKMIVARRRVLRIENLRAGSEKGRASGWSHFSPRAFALFSLRCICPITAVFMCMLTLVTRRLISLHVQSIDVEGDGRFLLAVGFGR